MGKRPGRASGRTDAAPAGRIAKGKGELAATEGEALDPKSLTGEPPQDRSLRPGRLGEFVGQELLKENLVIMIGAARKRGEPLEHLLFYGPPGLG
jgi:hypothetical protein